MAEPHLLQVFLSDNGVHEVTVTPGDHVLACTCGRTRCVHIEYIEGRLTNGDYCVEIPEQAVERMHNNLVGDPAAWRMFVIENAPVVVL